MLRQKLFRKKSQVGGGADREGPLRLISFVYRRRSMLLVKRNTLICDSFGALVLEVVESRAMDLPTYFPIGQLQNLRD